MLAHQAEDDEAVVDDVCPQRDGAAGGLEHPDVQDVSGGASDDGRAADGVAGLKCSAGRERLVIELGGVGSVLVDVQVELIGASTGAASYHPNRCRDCVASALAERHSVPAGCDVVGEV